MTVLGSRKDGRRPSRRCPAGVGAGSVPCSRHADESRSAPLIPGEGGRRATRAATCPTAHTAPLRRLAGGSPSRDGHCDQHGRASLPLAKLRTRRARSGGPENTRVEVRSGPERGRDRIVAEAVVGSATLGQAKLSCAAVATARLVVGGNGHPRHPGSRQTIGHRGTGTGCASPARPPLLRFVRGSRAEHPDRQPCFVPDVPAGSPCGWNALIGSSAIRLATRGIAAQCRPCQYERRAAEQQP